MSNVAVSASSRAPEPGADIADPSLEGLPMSVQFLNRLEIPHASGTRRIELFLGDLTAIPPDLRVDALVVSAFPDDYISTPKSLIGALHRKGISVADLAATKSVDLRATCSCWMSSDLTPEQAG